MMITSETFKVYVTLLEEGTHVTRPTQAIHLRDNIYKLFATEDYDPEDEIWEFLPGSIVKCEWMIDATGLKLLLAVEEIKEGNEKK